MNTRSVFAMSICCLSLASGAFAQAPAGSPAPFVDEFSGKKLDDAVWERSGNAGLSLATVKEGSLRQICEGMTQQSWISTKRGDFDFFQSPLTVVWDLDAERTLAGPYASTTSAKIYAGLSIGDTAKDAPAAELGLGAWPEGFPNPKPAATWYYTLNIGQLMPKEPSDDWRVLGVPTRIIWTLDATNASVTIDGAKFAAGDPVRRSAPHGLKRSDFTNGKLRLRMLASPHDKSMEPGANHIAAVVYTDSIRVLAPDQAAEYQLATPAAKPAEPVRTTPKIVVTTASPDLVGPPQYLFGVNYAGGTFRKETGFVVPTPESLDYYKHKGVLLMRLPFDWESLQPKLNQPLDEKYLNALKQTVRMMAERDMKVLLDLHNYAKYQAELIGTPNVPVEAFADVWQQLATAFKDEPAVWGYGLMNEPDRKTRETWPGMAQAAIDAIRAADKKTMIVVCADDFTVKGGVALLELRDPSNNLCFEKHTYFDNNNSGKYNHSYEFELNNTPAIDPMIGVRRLEPFVNWLKEHKVKGLLGEFSVPANPDRDPRWLPVLENVYHYLGKNQLPSTFWAGGTLWTPGRSYVLEPPLAGPQKGMDRPQMQILLRAAQKYAANSDTNP